MRKVIVEIFTITKGLEYQNQLRNRTFGVGLLIKITKIKINTRPMSHIAYLSNDSHDKIDLMESYKISEHCSKIDSAWTDYSRILCLILSLFRNWMISYLYYILSIAVLKEDQDVVDKKKINNSYKYKPTSNVELFVWPHNCPGATVDWEFTIEKKQMSRCLHRIL